MSQLTGRRRYLIGSGLVTATLVPLGHGLIVSGAVHNLVVLGLALILISVAALSIWGVVTPYVNERFSTNVRASGFGIGYSFAVIVPSFYAFFQNGLSASIPSRYTPLALLMVAGVLIVVGAWIGPETKDVQMGRVPGDD